MNIGSLLPRHARYRPDHLAVVFEGQRLTFDQFNRRVNRLAHALAGLGVGQGDKVATVLPNCLEQLDAYWAIAKLGAVVVPLSPLLRESGLLSLLRDSDTVVVIAAGSARAALDAIRADLTEVRAMILTDAEAPGYLSYAALTSAASEDNPPAVDIVDSDPYNIIYSSGTTGLPKGIVHTHYVRAMYCSLFANSWRMTPESVVLHAGSIVFNGAFLTLLPAMFLGCPYILHKQFNPEAVFETVEREGVTHIMAVPSQIIALLNAPGFDSRRLQSLQMVGSVGAPLHKEHREELARRLPGVFYELYGLTEGFVTILDKTDFERKPLSVGVPPPFYTIRICDESGEDVGPGVVGEIVGRGPILMPGYYKRPDLTAQAVREGWLFTGDLGYLDEDGYLFLVDRKKDMITSGGINVYPRDVEEIAVQHPAVREVAVFGIPDAKWGETPMAVVVLREPGAATPYELRQWINERVAARYQQVRDVVIVDDFPRNVAGKTLKRVMRDEYWASRETKV